MFNRPINMTKERFKVTKKMKKCYRNMSIPVNPLFKRAEVPILLLKWLACLLDELTPEECHPEGSIFYGSSGIGYALIRFCEYPLFQGIREDILLATKRFLDKSVRSSQLSKSHPASFMLGEAGHYAVSAVVYKSLGLQGRACHFLRLFQGVGSHCLQVNYNIDGGEDLCNGRAGYLMGALWLSMHFKKLFSPQFFYRYLDLMIEYCKEYSKKVYASSKLAYNTYDNQMTGILLGLSGVLFAILCFPSYLDKHLEVDEEVKQSVDCILLRQKPDGNFFPSMYSDYTIPGDILKWRSGASGILYLMAKAYMRWGHSRYYYSCLLIGDLIWNCGLEFIFTNGGNGSGVRLDHGLVGNLYGLLVLYRLTKFSIYLQQAQACSVILKDEKYYKTSSTKLNKLSLFGGLSGNLIYLLDLINAENAEFPFLDVFCSMDEL